MKKIIALVLASLFILTAFAGCSSNDEEDKGAIIQVYLTDLPFDLDPAIAYGNADVMQVFSLIYEGLTRLTDGGKLEKALAQSWEYGVDERDDQLKLEIKLKGTNWSDGIPVDAEDVVFAWKRLLLPETNSAAASLLYPVKNARAVKEGLMTIDDVGISAVSDYTVEVIFEEGFTDVEYFLECTASPALVPLREDIVSKATDWAQSPATMVCSGPFSVKEMSQSGGLVLERSNYYNKNNENTNAKVTKFVTPYRLVTTYADKKYPDQVTAFQNGEIFYLNLNSASAETYASMDKVKTTDLLSTYTYYFNTNNKLFQDARVRKALSLAIDRDKIAEIVGRKVQPATGLVPYGVRDESFKKDFRDVGGALLSTTADLEQAKTLLKEAGVKSGSFTLYYNNTRDYEKLIAEYCAEVWGTLGFKVDTQGNSTRIIQRRLAGLNEFDVVAGDYQALTADAVSFVAPFAKPYSGNVISVETEEVEYTPGVTGFDDAEYDALIDAVFAAKNNKERTAAMHTAEEYLMDKMPVMPLFYNTDSYVISGELSGLTQTFFGNKLFTKVSQKNYKKYLPEDEKETKDDKTDTDQAESGGDTQE